MKNKDLIYNNNLFNTATFPAKIAKKVESGVIKYLPNL